MKNMSHSELVRRRLVPRKKDAIEQPDNNVEENAPAAAADDSQSDDERSQPKEAGSPDSDAE